MQKTGRLLSCLSPKRMETTMYCVVRTENKMHYITNGINLFLPSINLHVKDVHCHFARLVRPTQ